MKYVLRWTTKRSTYYWNDDDFGWTADLERASIFDEHGPSEDITLEGYFGVEDIIQCVKVDVGIKVIEPACSLCNHRKSPS